MRIVLCIAAAAALAAGPAFAKDAASAQDAASNAVQATSAARTLYVCDNSAMTKRGFAREFGAAQYVTAEAALAKGEAWTQPKCITRSEARRLRQQQLAAR